MTGTSYIAVFGSSATVPGSSDWEDAESVGRSLAQAGLGVVTGGYGGTMEAASRGAALAGGGVIGVTAPPLFTGRFGANSHVSEEITAATLAERIGRLTEIASGVIVLPGSIGTAAELVVAWNMNHIARIGGRERLPTVAVGNVWRNLASLLTDEGGANAVDVTVVATADEAVEWMLVQPEIHAIVEAPL